MLEYNKLLKKQLEKHNEIKDVNKIVLLTAENKRLSLENYVLLKKYKTLKLKSKITDDNDNTWDFLDEENALQIPDNGDVINFFKRPSKNKNGKYDIFGKTYNNLVGSRDDVWSGNSYKTSGGLTKNDLIDSVSNFMLSFE
jgi:hypothetical protein